jgi:REP element-mobilizing transposase RayT
MIVIRQRKPNRLKNFNYSSSGYYFVTMCTKNRQEYFGNIINNKMILNEYGKITEHYWLEIPKHFNNVKLDEFIVMPNHVHGIIVIKNIFNPVGNRHACSLQNAICRRQNQLLSNIINLYKSTTSKFIHRSGINSFRWQKSFYDHIIRNEYSLFGILQYIRDNPRNWDEDRNNLINKSSLNGL